jgi:hypothetical protein
MSSPVRDLEWERAYVAAAQSQAAAAMRHLCAIEWSENPEVGAIAVECSAEGGVTVTLMGSSGQAIGGYSL